MQLSTTCSEILAEARSAQLGYRDQTSEADEQY